MRRILLVFLLGCGHPHHGHPDARPADASYSGYFCDAGVDYIVYEGMCIPQCSPVLYPRCPNGDTEIMYPIQTDSGPAVQCACLPCAPGACVPMDAPPGVPHD